MSQENVEIVRHALEATAGQPDLEAALSMLHPNAEWDMARVLGWTEQRAYRGHDAIRGFLVEWWASWESWRFEIEEVHDAANNRVLVGIREWGTGAETGVNVDQRRYLLYTLLGSKVARIEMFSERQEALEAAGLSEQDAHADS